MKILNVHLAGALASAALLGGSLFVGAGAATAAACPAGFHWNDMGNGAGWCAANASGGGTGGGTSVDGGGQKQGPIGQIVMPPQAPDAPAWTPPVYAAPPVYHPTAPQAPAWTPPQAQAPTYNAPVAGGTGTFVAPGTGQAIERNPQGQWVDPATGAAADPQVAAAADQAAAAAPAAEAKTPEAAARVKAAQEKVAAEKAQKAKADAVQKAAEIAIDRVQIEAAVTKALDSALAHR